MGKAVGKIALGAGVIAVGFATGGISLVPSAGLFGATIATTTLGGIALAAGAATALSGLTGKVKPPRASLAQIDRLNATTNPGTPRKIVFGGPTAMAAEVDFL